MSRVNTPAAGTAILGLQRLRSGGPRTTTAPTPGSRTQARKAELKSYSLAERQHGRVKK